MKKVLNPIVVIISLCFVFSCDKMEEHNNPAPTPTPTPKEAVVIDSGVDTKPTIKQEGGEAKVSFTATENWTASIINTKADSWISLDKTSGSAGSVTITITVQRNDTPIDRSATVQIKARNTTIDIVVSQKGKDSLTTTASKNEFGSEGGELTIEVKANIDFTYSIAEGCKDWISESGTKAMTTTTLTFKIAENEDVKKREGSVTIKSSLGEEVIKVYQSGTEPTIVITKNEYSVEAKGETIQVEVSSNVNVEMTIPDGCDWIKEEKTKAISTNTFYLNVLENTSLESRTAKVVFKNVENKLSEEITFSQAGRDAVQAESISLDKTELEISEGDNATLVATVLPENADNKNVIWNSSNAEIATVEDGVVTAIKEGEATITAKTEEGEKTATCSVKVKAKTIAVESVSLDMTEAILKVGEAVTLTATVSPEDATDKTVTWSSSDESIATVKDGVVTAIKVGSATITAKAGEKTATCDVTVEVKVIAVESVSLDKVEATLKVGETVVLTATVSPEDATDKIVTWSSSDESIATVKDGVVTAIKVGSATITAKAGDKTATCDVTVEAEITTTPFTITSIGRGTVYIDKRGNPEDISLEFRKGDGSWSVYNIGSKIYLSDGENVQFRAGAEGNKNWSGGYMFSLFNGGFNVSGNIMSLLDKTLEINAVPRNCFRLLFWSCVDLVDASKLELPATTLAEGCYSDMFYGCKSLTKAPELPATTLAKNCYNGMFSGCISLTKAPELPATTLATECYEYMFEGCRSLTKAPELPATTLAEMCYYSMFNGCSSLTKAPELPATTLATWCYHSMFEKCTSLTKAPELLATRLVKNCYNMMFYGCSKLNYVKALFNTNLAEKNISGEYMRGWLYGVSPTGTFVRRKDANWYGESFYIIPDGWEVTCEE